jgi:hypothetical protein
MPEAALVEKREEAVVGALKMMKPLMTGDLVAQKLLTV